MEDTQLWSPWEWAGWQSCGEQGSGPPGVFQDFLLTAEKLVSNGDKHTSVCVSLEYLSWRLKEGLGVVYPRTYLAPEKI